MSGPSPSTPPGDATVPILVAPQTQNGFATIVVTEGNHRRPPPRRVNGRGGIRILPSSSRGNRPRVDSSASSVSESTAPGMTLAVKHLYKDDIRRRAYWSESPPSPDHASTADYAIVVRNVFNDVEIDAGGGEGRTKMHSLVVQSPPLKYLLRTILHGYPGLGLNASKITFTVPFVALVHRWEELMQAEQSEADEENLAHIKLFLDTVRPAIQESLTAVLDFVQTRQIAFHNLWTIMAPKDILWTTVNKIDCAFSLRNTELVVQPDGTKVLLLQCSYVDWDGARFGMASKAIMVKEYSGVVPVTELSAYQLKFHPDESIRERLTARGRRFEELKGFHYEGYSGFALDTLETTPRLKHVRGRIVIDCTTYFEFNPSDEEVLLALNADAQPDPQSSGSDSSREISPPIRRLRAPPPSRRRRGYRGQRSGSSFGRMDNFEAQGDEDVALTTDQHLICSYRVRGFSLKLKQWLNFDVSNIVPITWNDTAFDTLVLPTGYKKLIMAFSNSQRRSAQVFDDVISGKGRGIVLLLNGPPGVGKTLTAESVAEKMQVPLYSISAGELGTNARGVEKKLVDVFDLAKAWNAVILLDEADVFLEKRRLEDIARNELVSIFLQKLEYFQSTLFLTTNRVETFDPAFESRIHISITYPPLDVASRRQIWTNFLTSLTIKQDVAANLSPTARTDPGVVGSHEDPAPNIVPEPSSVQTRHHAISEDDVDALSRRELNGRQIKNVIKAGELLALEDGEPLRMEHLQTVLIVMSGGRETSA